MAKEPKTETKWARIKPTTQALKDPYSDRMISIHDEDGFITTESHADFFISMGHATMLEAGCEPPERFRPKDDDDSKKRGGKVSKSLV